MRKSAESALPASMAVLLLSPRGAAASSPRASSAVHPSHMLLRNLRVEFGHRMSVEHGHTLYHMSLHNVASGRRWEVAKTSREVRAVQHAMERQLKQGHPCRDVCPWLFAHVVTKCPRRVTSIRSLPWSRKPPASTSTSLLYLKQFVTIVHGVFAVPPGQVTCPVLVTTISQLAVDFFYGSDYVHHELEASWLQSGALQSPRCVDSPSFQDAKDDERCAIDGVACGVCLQALDGDPLTSKSADDAAPHTPNQVGQISITTLPCGHPFHDECIVTHLNADLRCPVCGYVPKL